MKYMAIKLVSAVGHENDCLNMYYLIKLNPKKVLNTNLLLQKETDLIEIFSLVFEISCEIKNINKNRNLKFRSRGQDL